MIAKDAATSSVCLMERKTSFFKQDKLLEGSLIFYNKTYPCETKLMSPCHNHLTIYLFEFLLRYFMNNKLKVTHPTLQSIERVHSPYQRPYWFTKTKDDFCIKIEFHSRRNGLVHQYRRRLFVLEQQHGCREDI